MKIAVMGAGAIGAYFGGRIAQADNDVTLIARGDHLKALKANGLTVTSPLGDFSVSPIQASDDPAHVGVVDLVMFMVKNYDTEEAAQQMKPMIGPDTTVISFQNGVDARRLLSEAIGGENVLGGTALIPSSMPEPGIISHNGRDAKLVFGEFGKATSPRAEAFAEVLAGAGVHHEIHENIDIMLWSKFTFLASITAMNCMTRQSIGPVVTDPDSRALYLDAMKEVVAVGRASGVDLPESTAQERLEMTDNLPGGVKSSMFQDLERGKRLEVAHLSGTVARMGAELGVPTPIHRTAYAILKPYADGVDDPATPG